MSINRAENYSCTLQIARDFINKTYPIEVIYGPIKNSELLAFAVQAMEEMSIPVISVDPDYANMDQIRVKGILSEHLYIEYMYSVCRI